MSDTAPLSTEDRWAIVALSKHTAWNQERIAKQVKCSRREVNYVLSKYRETGDVVDLPRSGRPPLFDTRNKENNFITHTIENNRKSRAKDIKRAAEEQLNISVSVRTIIRLRRQLGYRPVLYRRRPMLSEAAKNKRYHYALDNLDNEWKDIIFTDETMFILTDEHKIIWKRPHEKPILKQFREYPQKQMVWGGIFF
jgi:transposase